VILSVAMILEAVVQNTISEKKLPVASEFNVFMHLMSVFQLVISLFTELNSTESEF